MDLIYTDGTGFEQGVILKYALDFEESNEAEECTFEVQTPIADSVLELGSYIYVEGAELGGRVDTIKIDTAANIIYSSGRTWRGILGSKILEPSPGDAYYSVKGMLSDVLTEVIARISLDSLFAVVIDGANDIEVNYTFNRYTDAYKGIEKLLAKYGYKLRLSYSVVMRHIVLSAMPYVDYANETELSSDMFEFKIQKGVPTCNHMIGLGSGTLENRMVVHKYLQEDGTIGDTQFYLAVMRLREYLITLS